jgi:membrane associated rhomboid family serine protease
VQPSSPLQDAPRDGDDVVARKLPFPWVTAVIIGGSILVAASDLVLRHPDGAPTLAAQWGALVSDFVREKQWWRLVSYTFVHYGPVHLGMNMLAAYNLGVPLERRLGSARFAEITLVTCLGGAAAVVLFAPHTATAGASGVLFGWLGLLVPLIRREGLKQLGRVILLNAMISFIPGISWQCHLGGFLAGLVCGLVLRFDGKRFSIVAPALVGGTAFLALWAAYRPQ